MSLPVDPKKRNKPSNAQDNVISSGIGIPNLRIEETAANSLKNKSEMETSFSIIESLTLNMPGRVTHGDIKHSQDITSSFYTIPFRISIGTMNISTITRLVKNNPKRIRNIRLKWKVYGITIAVEVYHHWVVPDEKNEPSVAIGSVTVGTTGLSLPKHTHTTYRETFFNDMISNMEIEDLDKIDVEALSKLCHAVYNMEKNLPQLSPYLDVNRTGNTYALGFSGMRSVSYDFLEYVCHMFTDLLNIQFKSDGNTTNDIVFVFRWKRAANNQPISIITNRFDIHTNTNSDSSTDVDESKNKKQKTSE